MYLDLSKLAKIYFALLEIKYINFFLQIIKM